MFKRSWRVFLAMAAAGAMAGFLTAAVIVYVTPRKYESETVIEVRPLPAEKTSLETDLVPEEGRKEPPIYLRAAAEQLRSDKVLRKTVENLKLANKWNMDQEAAIGILKDIVITQNIRNSDLISIRVRHPNRENARDIAAEVVRVCKIDREEIIHRDMELRLSDLTRPFQAQKDKIEKSRIKVAELARYLSPQPNDQDYLDAKRELEADEALLQTMKLKLLSESIGCKLFDGNIVVHEESQLADSPASPNVPLALSLGTAGGLLLSPLLALPLIWLLRLNPAKRTD